MPDPPLVLVSGFEPFGGYAVNPSAGLAMAVDGRRVGGCEVRGLVLPVQHERARAVLDRALEARVPLAVLHLGLAGGRARLALERVAVNVLDYELPDADGRRILDEACVPDGPAAYFSTLPLAAMLAALTEAGIPAYVSETAGTYLCNQTLYWTLHRVARQGLGTRVGLVHLPLLPAMVAATGTDQPSMDLGLLLRAVDVLLGVVAGGPPREGPA